MKKTISLLLVLVLCMVAKGDFTFGEPTNLGPTINSSDYDFSPSITADGLELYFESDRPGGEGSYDIWVSTRAAKEDDWGAPTNLGPPINTWDWQNSPCISADGLELYFNDWGLWVVRRATVSDPWGEPENDSLININTSNVNSAPCLSSDGLSLFLFSWDETELYISTRPTRDDLWSEPVNLGPTVNGVNSTWENRDPSISADGLVLFFISDRPGGSGGTDLWMTRRSTIDGPWSEPVNLGPTINGDRWEYQPEISADGRTLLFCSNRREGRYGSHDIWQVPIITIVDFNGDGKVNGKDVVVLTQHWGEGDSVCDIGPYAWGDGIVDEQDLFALAEYLEEEFVDPTLIAHWALDEAEGPVASDSAGENDAMVMGNSVWQPDAGVFGGALAFDGVDDFVLIPALPRLGDGPFSILAWVKGGAPDQVVISHTSGGDWLYANPLDGSLMSGLSSSAGDGMALFSDTVITDGQWHRIGLVWDGTNRILFVDEQEVARDEQAELAIHDGSLMIGTAGAATPGRYFTGLIDDIRVYRRALKP